MWQIFNLELFVPLMSRQKIWMKDDFSGNDVKSSGVTGSHCGSLKISYESLVTEGVKK